jgi:hypothetical protein
VDHFTAVTLAGAVLAGTNGCKQKQDHWLGCRSTDVLGSILNSELTPDCVLNSELTPDRTLNSELAPDRILNSERLAHNRLSQLSQFLSPSAARGERDKKEVTPCLLPAACPPLPLPSTHSPISSPVIPHRLLPTILCLLSVRRDCFKWIPDAEKNPRLCDSWWHAMGQHGLLSSRR